jgi:hypothetical protein
MNKLITFCDTIAYLCRTRYELIGRDVPNLIGITEQIDLSLYKVFDDIKKEYQLNTPEATFVFEKFFLNYLEDSEDWVYSRATFGKDFEFTKDFIKEILERL